MLLHCYGCQGKQTKNDTIKIIETLFSHPNQCKGLVEDSFFFHFVIFLLHCKLFLLRICRFSAVTRQISFIFRVSWRPSSFSDVVFSILQRVALYSHVMIHAIHCIRCICCIFTPVYTVNCILYMYTSVITKTSPCNEHPLTPHFYIVKLGFTGVYIFFLFLLQNIDCGYSLEPPH